MKIKVVNYKKLLEYDDKTGKIIFFLGKIKFGGIYSVSLVLYDQYGQENSVMITIKILSKIKFVVPEIEPIAAEKIKLRYVNPLSKNFTAEILKISHEGEVKIKFNTTLDLDDGIEFFNNMTTLKLIPANDRNLTPDFDSEKLNFTWYIKSFKPNGDLIIKIEFKHTVYISPEIVQDMLHIEFNSSMLLYSPTL